MTELLKQAFNPDTFREQGHQLVNALADYLELNINGKSNQPVLPYSSPEKLFEFWNKELWKQESSFDDIYLNVINNSIHLHNPKYMGHQVSPALPLTALSDLLSSFLNNSLAVYEMGSTGIVFERIIIKLIAEAVGMNSSADGVFTSGGTIGNLTALLAARQIKAKNNIWKEGNRAENNPVILVSEECHYSVERAVRIMGLGDNGIIKIPVNKNHKLDVKIVKENYLNAVKAGKHIIALVANACSTSLGLFDPLDELAEFCRENNLWFHVDAAHGGPAAFSGKYKNLLSGIEQADSVVIDFHKMLLHPSLLTAVIFKEENNSYQTFSQKAKYLWESRSEKEWFNSGKRTLECTKNAMSMKVYFTLKIYGTQIFDDNVTVLFDLGKKFSEMIKTRTNFELAVEPESNIVCFRFIPAEVNNINIDDLNKKLRQAVIEDGEYFIVQTEVKGSIYFRTCLMNPFTTENELSGLLDKIEFLSKEYLINS